MSIITERDRTTMKEMALVAGARSSGGSYDMVCWHVKGSRVLAAGNRLNRAAHPQWKGYPRDCGTHAELALWWRAKTTRWSLRGGTVYITGVKARNDRVMTTTKPCEYCVAVLAEAKVGWVVYWFRGKLQKKKATELVAELNSVLS
jgi:tRNA(Arg) A34 adenosine deaminase TadA